MKLKLIIALTLYNLGQGDKMSTQKIPISNKSKNFMSETKNVRRIYFPKSNSSSIIYCFYGHFLSLFEKVWERSFKSVWVSISMVWTCSLLFWTLNNYKFCENSHRERIPFMSFPFNTMCLHEKGFNFKGILIWTFRPWMLDFVHFVPQS